MKEVELPKVGISTCLLGKNVRYNAGHKLDEYLKDVFGKYVEYVPICPEVEAGFGVPRETVQLHEKEDGIKMITLKTNRDLTPQMNAWLDKRLNEIEKMNLTGYILKSKSPSCGVFRTRLYREGKEPSLNGRGLFAKALISKFPELLVEEEGRLHNPVIRDNYIQSLFIHYRWKGLNSNLSVHGLIKFHERIKYTLMSHSPIILKDMGKVVAQTVKGNLEGQSHFYFKKLNEALSQYADIKKNRNVLDHIMGYFKKDLNKDEKAELKEVIENYSNSLVPLIVPITLLNHYVRKYDQKYLKDQFYLNPTPMELMLRNHV